MKKIKIEFNYQTAKVALYTLLVLDIISFSNFSESKAKYYKTEPNVLSWDASLYQMYKANRIMLNKPNYETSTLTLADFTFSFPRNVIGSFNSKDEYEIILPTGCTIQSTSTNGKVNGNKITYTNTNTNTSHVAMQCEVEKILKEDSFGQKFLDFDIEIYEKIDNEAKFLYTDTHYQQLYDLYKANIPDRPIVEEVPPYKSIKESETNKYAIFMEWIEKYAKQFPNEKDIVKFVKDHCIENDYESVKNLVLPGLRVTYDKDTDSYVYTLSDNFVEYVKLNNDENKGTLRIITTTDTLEMETAFEFYLKEHFLKDYDEKEKETLFNLAVSYVKSIDERGIAHILIPDESGNYQTIPGLTITDSSKGQPVQEVLITESKFFDYAYNKLNKVIRISFSTSSIMRRTFRENLPIVYDDQTISPGAIQTLPTYAELNNSVTTNKGSATETWKSFSDYFILPDEDNNHNLLINVYSNVGNDAKDEYNYAKVSILNYDNFVFAETMPKFSVYAKDKDTIIKFVEELDKVYNKTTVLTDADFTFGTNLFSIEYSTIKQSTPVINGGAGPDTDADTNPDDDQTPVKDELQDNSDNSDSDQSINKDETPEDFTTEQSKDKTTASSNSNSEKIQPKVEDTDDTLSDELKLEKNQNNMEVTTKKETHEE